MTTFPIPTSPTTLRARIDHLEAIGLDELEQLVAQVASGAKATTSFVTPPLARCNVATPSVQ